MHINIFFNMYTRKSIYIQYSMLYILELIFRIRNANFPVCSGPSIRGSANEKKNIQTIDIHQQDIIVYIQCLNYWFTFRIIVICHDCVYRY